LNQAGIPATHNSVFEGRGWQWQRIEASWRAADHLPVAAHVVHVVRHPLNVIQSILETKFLDTCDHGLELPANELEAAMRLYLEWNRKVEPYNHQFIRIENLSTDDLAIIAAKAGGRHNPTDMLEPLAKVHNSPRPLTLGWKDLPVGDHRVELEVMAKGYGYEL
jgi:hypothetical protein